METESKLPAHLWIDRYGRKIWARTVAELRERAGGGKVSKMYCDKVAGPHAGKTVHCGYIVGDSWFSRFAPVEIPE